MLRLACLATMLLSTVPAAPTAADEKRPNILFAFADDWGRYAGAYARLDGPGGINDVVRTPNFDRVAGEGVLFRSAFVSAPSCTPCRSALLSGQHFWRTGRGAILQGAVWDAPGFPHGKCRPVGVGPPPGERLAKASSQVRSLDPSASPMTS